MSNYFFLAIYAVFYLLLKKATELSCSSRFKIYILMISMLIFAFKITKPIIFFWSQGIMFSTVKGNFPVQGVFPHSRKVPTKKNWSRKFSIANAVFHKMLLPWSKKFFSNKNFLQAKNQKGSVKAKILDPFNTKSHAKYF